MPQIKKSYTEVTIPLTKMTFTPDVPSAALGANEYNQGENVEADVRGIRSVLGDEFILSQVTGTPFYITGGYRYNAAALTPEKSFFFIVATVEGKWWMTNDTTWTEITPPSPFDGSTYAPNTNITEAWNGTVLILNDGINAPFFLPDESGATLINYSNTSKAAVITNISAAVSGQRTLTFTPAAATAPFVAGDIISVQVAAANSGGSAFNGAFTVVSSTTSTVTYTTANTTATWQAWYSGVVDNAYVWNYNPDWKNLTAGFIRIYSTPNVGNILVAGDLTVTDNNDIVTNYPVTVRWSQAFGLNSAPLTWMPTVLNVANEVEVPLRGRALDAFPSNGQLFISSYWDTAVLTPMNYATTSAPILGIRLFNQGRGLLNANCWANTDDFVYGIDARDVWAFNGQSFVGIGNQRVKHWLFDQLDPANWDMVYVETNTEKNQVEIYYPDSNASEYNGKLIPNKMLSYRYDLDCWNAPRDVTVATFACESPVWSYDDNTSTWSYNPASRTLVYAQGVENSYLVQKDQSYYFREITGDPRDIVATFRRDNIKLVKDYSSKTLVHRILPEAVNLNDNNVEIDPTVNPELVGNVAYTVEGANSVGQTPQQVTVQSLSTDTDYPWVQINQNAHRVNSLEITTPTDATATPGTVWMVTAATWQFTEVEDDR